MSTNQSSSRQALGAIMGTVTTTAQTVTATIGTANKAVGMLNKMVSDAADRQQTRSVLDNHIYTATLHQEKAKELTESRRTIDEYIKQSDRHAELYSSAFDELASILNPQVA